LTGVGSPFEIEGTVLKQVIIIIIIIIFFFFFFSYSSSSFFFVCLPGVGYSKKNLKIHTP